MASVNLQQLRKSFDGNTDVLAGIDLDIAHGEFVVLVGPSGCGKSTLLRMLCGLEAISGGTMAIDGQVVNRLPPAQRGVAMVFQSYALYPHMNVYKNMAFGLKVAGECKAAIKERIHAAAAILKIDHLLERLPRELSGGQRQRVAIGRAIVREPKLFLFDEPLSNLDAALRVQTRLEIAKLHRRLDATIVYVTHDQVEAMTLGDKIVVMHDGKIQQAGTPLELYQQPCNQFVATFIGSPMMNLLPGIVTDIGAVVVTVDLDNGARLRAAVDGSGLRVGDRIQVGVRAEHLREQRSASETLAGRVSIVEHLGESNYIYITMADGRDIVMRGDGEHRIAIGAEIECTVNSNDLHVFDADGRACARRQPGNMLAAQPHDPNRIKRLIPKVRSHQ